MPRAPRSGLRTREHLLDAAEALFLAHGVTRTSLEAIAREAGLTRGAIYWHFKNKGELLQAAKERIRATYHPRAFAQVAITPSDSFNSLMVLAAETVLSTHGQARQAQLLSLIAVSTTCVHALATSPLRHHSEASVSQFAGHLAKLQMAGRLRAHVQIESAAIGLACLVDGLSRQLTRSRQDKASRDLVNVAVYAYLAGLTPCAPTEQACWLS